MVVVMQSEATEEQIQKVAKRLEEIGFAIHRTDGATCTILAAVGEKLAVDARDFELLEGVREVHRISAPYKLASRRFRPEGTVVDLGKGVKVGGHSVVVMAGPCSVETREQIMVIAGQVSQFFCVDYGTGSTIGEFCESLSLFG